MATFKVFEQIGKPAGIGKGQFSYVARVTPIEGVPEPGMTFCGYETYHPVDFVIRTVEPDSDGMLRVDYLADWNLYEGFLTGTFVDTSGDKRGVHFFWDHEKKYRPHSDIP
jgi:hypothetical protein